MNTEWSQGLREMNDMTSLCLFRNNCVYFWWAFCNSNNVILSQNLSVWVARFHQNITLRHPDGRASAVKKKIFSRWTRMWAIFLPSQVSVRHVHFQCSMPTWRTVVQQMYARKLFQIVSWFIELLRLSCWPAADRHVIALCWRANSSASVAAEWKEFSFVSSG